VKLRIATIALCSVFAVALVAGVVYAQAGEGGSGGMHHRGHGGFMGGMGMGLPLHQLNLTADQKAQIKQIFESEKPAIKPLRQQEMQAHQQLIQLVTSGTFDQAKATAIATQEAQTHIQMQVEHAKIGAQIYQLLSSDQKAKVADMIAKHQQKMQEHMQNGQQAPQTEQQ
jgi:protein CpxP